MKKWSTISLSVLLASAIGITGCSNSGETAASGGSAQPQGSGSTSTPASKEQVTLRMTYWAGSQLTVDRNNAVVQLFEKAYPNIKVEAEYYSGDAYWDKLSVLAASNNMPDVVRMDYSKITSYVNKNLLLPLDDYVKDKTIDLEGVNPIHNAGGTFNNKLYGVNIGNNALVMFYNPDLLAKAGVTPPGDNYSWEQYEKDLKTIKDKLGIYGDTHLAQLHFGVWLRQKGSALFNKTSDGLGYTDDKLFVDFFKQQLRWQKEGLITPLGTELEVKSLEDGPFTKAQAAFGGFSYWSNHVDIMEKQLQKKVGLAMYPGDGKGMYIKPSFFHSISKSSKHPKEAAQFIEFYTNNIEAAKSLNAYFGMPYNPKVIEGIKSTFTDTQKNVVDYLTKVEKVAGVIDPPEPAAGAEVAKIYKNISDEILFEKITPEAGAERFRKEATAVLSKK
ncbi:ABC transporter substrate-binding protein [Paenibacillus thalictri]|uniref:Extracellular solute-binding protein n=1 Tax=Paenibacillus thalictri TaxID=2527873 RepID=A0A4Q9DUR4_9BACL|nr:extracellular solute-binding protein [Paenibacillus thalictri]TBL80754.1 extracellular solute-binding protein [Paenibacillus thalictri]